MVCFIIAVMKRKMMGLAVMLVAGVFLAPKEVEAAKKRVWTKATTAAAPSIAVKRKWDNLYVSFYNLKTTDGATYELTYVGNGLDQGIFGSVKTSEGNSVVRTLYFGTCSNKACTPHKNVSQVKLGVSFKMKNGTTISKRYRLKI